MSLWVAVSLCVPIFQYSSKDIRHIQIKDGDTKHLSQTRFGGLLRNRNCVQVSYSVWNIHKCFLNLFFSLLKTHSLFKQIRFHKIIVNGMSACCFECSHLPPWYLLMNKNWLINIRRLKIPFLKSALGMPMCKWRAKTQKFREYLQ